MGKIPISRNGLISASGRPRRAASTKSDLSHDGCKVSMIGRGARNSLTKSHGAKTWGQKNPLFIPPLNQGRNHEKRGNLNLTVILIVTAQGLDCADARACL